MANAEHPAVTKFREYIRIKTVQPSPDYASSTTFLLQQAAEIGLASEVIECVPGKPMVILTLQGQDPSLPSIMLNSHTDVVPVESEYWKYDPFSAHKDENGDIYGRGTQDMKCVGIQYLEALRTLLKKGIKLQRTVHCTFAPDEEIGSVDGMRKFITTPTFKNLNVGFALDEGMANTTDKFNVFYGDRITWLVLVKCKGHPGHGSQFLPNTAGEKLRNVINSFMSFRDSEQQRLKDNPDLSLGDVTTCNLTMLEGGVQFNVVPAELSVGFDVRISPKVDLVKFEAMIDTWCKEAGPDVTYEFEIKDIGNNVTCVEDGKSVWWDTFSRICKEENISIVKGIFSASPDIRFLRQLGIPALAFSPINKTPLLLHDHNEYLNESIFLRGIEIYSKIIPAIANLKIAK